MDFQQIQRLNQKIVDQSPPADQELDLVREALKGLGARHKPSELDEKTAAFLLTFKADPNDIKENHRGHAANLQRFYNLNEQDLIKKILPNNQYFFLCRVRAEKAITKNDVERIAFSYKLTQDEIEHLQEKRFVDWFDEKELRRLKDPSKAVGTYELKAWRERGLIDYLTPKEKKFIRSLDGSTPTSFSVKVKQILHDIDDNRLKAMQRLGFINLIHGEGATIKPIKVNQDLDAVKVRDHCVRYREKESLLPIREKMGANYDFHLAIKDQILVVKALREDELRLGEKERLAELRCFHRLEDIGLDIPTNAELFFLEKISGRRYHLTAFKKVAKDDFQISPERVDQLQKAGFFESRETVCRINWRDPLPDERTWLATRKVLQAHEADKVLGDLGIKRPHPSLDRILKQEIVAATFKPKVGDYEIYFKVLREDSLTQFEQRRVSHLRRSGIHPESQDFKLWVHSIPQSYSRMQKARREAFLNHYEKVYGVPYEALHWINTFKQVPHELLEKIGIKKEAIAQMISGIGSKNPNRLVFPLAKKHSINTEHGRIDYYSLTHEGIISGRKFLERKLPKSEIFHAPQRRQDLLYHDLQVGLCVFEVKKELEARGKKVVAIKNESKQFADSTTGKQNHDRTNIPSFMDAVMIIEDITEQDATGSQGSKGSSSRAIAVEYGNYTVGRMQEKIDKSSFDEAYIFAQPEYIQQYKQQIVTQKTIHYRVWR